MQKIKDFLLSSLDFISDNSYTLVAYIIYTSMVVFAGYIVINVIKLVKIFSSKK